tara:strand:+ start:152 stop:643 length:492 start_codon:yes stop_codon:yes gene_type:complete
MEPEEVAHDLDIYRVAAHWSRSRRSKFPKWEIAEIINEAWVQLKGMMHRYDPDRGSIQSFAKSSLWSSMTRAYCKAHEIRIHQRKGQKHQREYYNPFTHVDDLDQFTAKQQPVSPEIPEIENPMIRATLNLLVRGLTQRQVASACGVTESAVSLRVKTLRGLL